MSLPIPESWFDTKGKMNDEEPATPEELHGLKDYLREATPTSAFKAAKCIMTMNESRIPLTGKDNRVAWLILDAMICFPDRQTALLDLVDAIYKLSDDDVGLNSHLKDKYPQWRKWKSFSRFAELVDEMRRGSYSRKDAAQFLIQCQQAYWAYRYTPEEDDADPKDCFRRWANINALMAHHYVRASEPRGWPTYCLSIIRDGLEQKSSDALMLNAEVPASAQWLLIIGEDLYRLVGDLDQTNIISPSDLYDDRMPGLRKQRWDLWKSRLSWVQTQVELNDETKAIARKAYERMSELEIITTARRQV